MTLSVGDSTCLSKTIREVDVTVYAAISLDANPIHLDEEYARQTPFGRRIAQGMLSAGLISACIGTRLPGPGSIYLSQDLRFRRSAQVGAKGTALR